MKDPFVFSQFPLRQMFGFRSHSSTSRKGGKRRVEQRKGKNVNLLNTATIKEKFRTMNKTELAFVDSTCHTGFDKL